AVKELLRGDQRPGPVADIERDRAEAAALLRRILRHGCALGVTVLRDGAERRLATDHRHADHSVILPQLDALYALGYATHGWNVVFGESYRTALPRHEHDVVRTLRYLHVQQAVAFLHP